MATTDVEVLSINTQPSVKSLASLKQEIKDLKSQLLSLDQGTEEYNQALSELGNKMHDLKEVNEQAAMTNSDFGTNLSNTSKALAGMSGAVQTVTGTLSLMGVQIGDDSKLLKTLVSAMAITQGIAAMEQGVKAVKALGLTIKAATAQQKLFNAAALKNPYIIAGAAILATITAIVAAIKKQKDAEEEQHETRMGQLNAQLDLQRKIALEESDRMANLAVYAKEVARLTQEEIDKKKELEKQNFENAQAEYESRKADLDSLTSEINKVKELMSWQERHNQSIVESVAKYHSLIETLKEVQAKSHAAVQEMANANDKIEILNKTVGVVKKTSDTTVKSLKEIKDAVDYKDYYDALNNYYSLLNEMLVLEKNNAVSYNEAIKKNISDYIKAQKELVNFLKGKLEKELEKVGESFEGITYKVNEQKGVIEAMPKEVARLFMEYQKAENILVALYNEDLKINKAEEERLRLNREINIEAKHEMDTSDNIVKDLEAQIRLLRMEGLIMDENNRKNKKKSVLNPNPTNTFGDIKQEEDNQLLLAETKFQITQEGLDREYNAQKTYYENLSDLYKDDQAKQLEISNALRELDVQYEKDTLENHQELEKKKVEISQQATEQQIALINMYIDAYQTMSGAISGIIGSIADTQEQGTKEWKNLKTAEAIINTLAGGVGAFMSGVNSGLTPPFNIVLGAALAASTLAAGFAEVKKIQDTKVSKNSSSSSVRQATVQTINNNPSNVRTTNPQWNDEGQIENNITETNTTVTLVTSDLEALNSQNVNIQNNNQF